LVDELIKAERC